MTVRHELWFYKSVARAEVGPYTGGSRLPNWGK